MNLRTALIAGSVLAGALTGCAPHDEPPRSTAPQGNAAKSASDARTLDSMLRPTGKHVRRAEGGLSISTTAGAEDSPLEYDAPASWTPGKARGMRRAVFHVTQGDQKVEITAIELPGTVDVLLPNVNRWRKQCQLRAIAQAELAETVSPIQVDGVEGRYIELVGPQDAERRLAMLRVLVAAGNGKTWLFSMTGDADLALQEKERFQGFLKSVKLSAVDKSNDNE